MAEHAQWEYLVRTLGTMFRGEKDEALEATLNEWGLDGWEVISARGVENTSKVVIVAKRPLTSATRRRHSFPPV
jgi:hypothetical protein